MKVYRGEYAPDDINVIWVDTDKITPVSMKVFGNNGWEEISGSGGDDYSFIQLETVGGVTYVELTPTGTMAPADYRTIRRITTVGDSTVVANAIGNWGDRLNLIYS